MKISLGISYDGTPFFGWQSQLDKSGVQDALELAIARIAQHAIRVHAAGRTDTGVHALGQVVHFEAQVERPLSAWVRGVNAHLPSTVRVQWAREVADDFHARFSARSRSYQYVLYNAPVESALMADHAGWYHLPLDIAAMQEAMRYLVGEHDFSAFRAAQCQAKSPIRTITKAEVHQEGRYFIFDFSANAFLHHQVRNMIGALIYIGKGAHPPSYIQDLLQKRNRILSPPTFSPKGLYLTSVSYDAKWGLPDLPEKLTVLL
ncbi:MAG TPA: tRNA pseudouridine(38-40) synthase TruA [Methylotenera sp.]|nr:tRNA pseudouridine(38-40) synthase TruA [Methylotenera sp.]HPH05018.1 tRNA pseudouridine(38-40) synthase TruA [Methylotenera sp.]HPN00280.1 tRNA pseudouridine(38-40) synthase TruA [Methylotenera sp.]